MGLYADRIFPWIIEGELTSPEINTQRTTTLLDVVGEVLEIGFGSGANLPCYPAHVRSLSAIEPSEGMTKRATRRLSQWGGTIDLRHLAGEQLPFEGERFDTVVITLTLCSVSDVSEVLSEARRVLRQGGRLLFLEHVASTDTKARAWQERLNALHQVIACGCQLNRDVEGELSLAGFSVERLERLVLPIRPNFLAWLYPAIRGIATKRP